MAHHFLPSTHTVSVLTPNPQTRSLTSRMMDGLLQYHQQPYRWRLGNLLARTATSCWLTRDKKVHKNLTLSKRGSTPTQMRHATPAPAGVGTSVVVVRPRGHQGRAGQGSSHVISMHEGGRRQWSYLGNLEQSRRKSPTSAVTTPSCHTMIKRKGMPMNTKTSQTNPPPLLSLLLLGFRSQTHLLLLSAGPGSPPCGPPA